MEEKHYRYLFQTLLFLLVFLTRFHTLYHGFYGWDEPATMSEAWAMTQGQVLYRDIYEFHPPFHFFVFIPFFAFLPTDVAPIAVKLMNICILYAGALLIRKLALALYSDTSIADLAAILFVFYLGLSWAPDSFGEFYSVFPILLALYLLLTRQTISAKTSLAIGILCWTAFYFKQIAFFDIVPLAILMLFIRKEPLRTKMRNVLFLLPAFAIVTMVAFMYAFWNNAVAETAQGIFFRNVIHYISGNSMFPDIGFPHAIDYFRAAHLSAWTLMEEDAIRFGLFPIFLLALCLAVIRGKLFILPESKQAVYFSLIWIAFICLGFKMSGRFYKHYTIQYVTPLILLYCAYLSELPLRFKKAAVVLSVLCCFYGAGDLFLDKHRDNLNARNEIRRSAEIAEYIKANTHKNDTIFLFNEFRLDIFYLSERLSANGIYLYEDMDSVHTNDPAAEKEMRERLKRAPPRVFVCGKSPFPDTSLKQFFQDLIREKYILRKEMNGVNLYFLRT